MVGQVLWQQRINPAELGGTRLASVAGLWNRWRPVSLNVRVVPSAGTYVSGALAVGWDASVQPYTDSGLPVIQRLATLVPNKMEQISKNFSISITKPPVQPWLYCRGDEVEDTAHGRVVVAVLSPLSNVDGNMAVTVHLDWNIVFDGPSIPAGSTSSGTNIYAGSGFESYFTDSTASWADGKKLTLKAHEGGQIVPFLGIQHGVIYQIDTVARLSYKLKPVDGVSAVKPIKYGVAIAGSTFGNGMAVFDDITSAESYIKSSDTSYCLDYYAAGEVVQPENPVWTPIATHVQEQRAGPSGVSSSDFQQLLDRLSGLEARVSKTAKAGTSGEF
jgi:hypothetical protein